MYWNPKVAAPRTGLALLLCVAGLAAAQEPQPVTMQPTAAPAATSQPTSMPSVLPSVPTYGGDLWKREYLTGDWWGARQTLADNGVLFNFDLRQVFQHNAHGGDRVVLPSAWPTPLLTGARALGLAAGVLEPARRPDDWMIYYNFDQFV